MGTHDAFIISYVESKFQLPTFYRLLVMSKSILICQNLQARTKTMQSREVPNTSQENGISYTPNR